MIETITPHLILAALAFFQTMAFSMVSRARNRDSTAYHVGASLMSNTVWFMTFRQLTLIHDFGWAAFPAYLVGTVLGSLYGAKLSMRIEAWLGAST